jgi:hypothetical protein
MGKKSGIQNSYGLFGFFGGKRTGAITPAASIEDFVRRDVDGDELLLFFTVGNLVVPCKC